MLISAAKASEAAAILQVDLPTLDETKLKKAYWSKVRDHHPDSADNYDPEVWGRVSWANEVLGHWLRNRVEDIPSLAEKDCRACGGAGRVSVGTNTKSFAAKPITVQCVMCAGSGAAPNGGSRGYQGGKDGQ